MTDKVQKIRKEVEERYEYWKEKESNSHSIESEIRMSECQHLLLMLDSLQEEPVSEDLEYASEKYACRFSSSKYGHDKVKDAFIAGAKWQKEQMMKGLCYETKVYYDSDGTAEDGNYEEWLNLEQSEIIDIPFDELGLKDGDIVKVIIIKEEEE